MTLRICLLVTCLVTISAAPYDNINIDKKQYLCGRKFVDILSHYCKMHNTPDDLPRREPSDQSSGQIVNYCCTNKCSPRGLVMNFCKEVKQEYEHIFAKALNDQEKTNTIVSEKGKEGESRESKEITLAPAKVVSKKGPRCGRRRKNRNFRNTRRAHDHPSSSPSKAGKSKALKRKCRCCKRKPKMGLPSSTLTKSIPEKPHPKPLIGFNQRRNDFIFFGRPTDHQHHLRAGMHDQFGGRFLDPFPNSSLG